MHSSLPPSEQSAAFRVRRPGQWKIVLSTNICEAAVTIDGVSHVVDGGTAKDTVYDAASDSSSLCEVLSLTYCQSHRCICVYKYELLRVAADCCHWHGCHWHRCHCSSFVGTHLTGCR